MRQPSEVTLKIRAMAKVERLKDKMAKKQRAEEERRAKYDYAMGQLKSDLEAAQKAADPQLTTEDVGL